MIQMQLPHVIYVSSGYIWDLINLTLLNTNIFKNKLILSFVHHVVVQFHYLVIWQTRIFLDQCLVKTTLKSPVKTVLSSQNHLLIWHSYLISLITPPQMFWILDTLVLTKSNHQNFPRKRGLSLFFHINACSLKETFDDHVYLLKCTKKILDLIPVCETRIFKKTSLTSNVNLNNSSFESTSVESTVGGTMLYISNHLSNKPQIDLNIYKKSTGLYFYWNN